MRLKSNSQVIIKCLCPQRATAGLRRTTAELTDGNQDSNSSNNNTVNDSPTPTQPTDPVAMEISSSPPLTDLERENLVSWRDQEVEELHYPETHEIQPIKDKQEEEEAEEGANGDECDYLVFEIGGKKEGKERGESEEGQKTERGGEEGEDGGRGGTEGKDEGRGEVDADDINKGERESADCGRRETEGEDGGGEDSKLKADALAELLFLTDSPVCPSPSEPPVVISHPSEQPATALLQEALGHDLSNRDDLSDGHLSDCLQAELAIVYSDSEAGEDQWAAFAPCDVTNLEEAGGAIRDSICDSESKEGEERGGEKEERGKEEDEAEEQREREVEKRQEERRGSRDDDDDDDEEQMRSRIDVFLRSPSVSSTASSTDPDRRVRPPPLLSLQEFVLAHGKFDV